MKVTDFISLHFHNYQQILAPSIIITYYLPQDYYPLERYRRTDKILHPLFPKLFFSTEHVGPYLQVHVYWAGQTMEWMANQTSFTLLHFNLWQFYIYNSTESCGREICTMIEES